MDLIKDSPKKLYRHYLLASIASSLAGAIYAFIDTIAVGQYAGPDGAAAIAVAMPIYGIFSFFAILCSVGGCIWMAKADGEKDLDTRNRYFTCSILLLAVCTAAVWLLLALFDRPLLAFFGADEALMPTVYDYSKWLIWFAPTLVLPTALGSYLRNDHAPRLAMLAVIIGGSANIFGDWFIVFYLDMGVSGAGLATVVGCVVQMVVMGSHFLGKKCTLRMVPLKQVMQPACGILSVGMGASIINFATIFINILMNNQIMRYGSATDLAIYGVIATIAAVFQSIFSGMGQSVQPLISANLGARRPKRIAVFGQMAFTTVVLTGIGFLALGLLFPTEIMRLFIAVDDAILAAAPHIVYLYFPLFLFQGICVLSIYYLQSILRATQATVLALARSAVLSGVFLILLPIVLKMDGVWLAQPFAEALTAALALVFVWQSRSVLRRLRESPPV